MTSLITRDKSSGPWEGYQTISRSVGGGKEAHNQMMILWNYEQHPTMINTSWWRVGEWVQLDQLRIMLLKDILWFDKHHTIESNATLERHLHLSKSCLPFEGWLWYLKNVILWMHQLRAICNNHWQHMIWWTP